MTTSIFEPPKVSEGPSHRSMSMLVQYLWSQDLSVYSFIQVYEGYRNNNEALDFVTQALDFAVPILSKDWEFVKLEQGKGFLITSNL